MQSSKMAGSVRRQRCKCQRLLTYSLKAICSWFPYRGEARLRETVAKGFVFGGVFGREDEGLPVSSCEGIRGGGCFAFDSPRTCGVLAFARLAPAFAAEVDMIVRLASRLAAGLAFDGYWGIIRVDGARKNLANTAVNATCGYGKPSVQRCNAQRPPSTLSTRS
jgi:hypothetical protein